MPPEVRSADRKSIGVIWSSSQWNPARSIPLELLLKARDGCDADLFSLQHGPDRERIATIRPYEGDVPNTAAEMRSMDLIISADTMTAHLAGALGLPVWVLLPFKADCAGCCTGSTARGTRPCACFGNLRRAIGLRPWPKSETRS
jgi:hypothetical protein